MKTAIKIWLPWAIFIIGSAHAEVRQYIDANGVIRFKNIPSAVEQKQINGKKPQRCQFDNIIRQAGGMYGINCALIKAVIHAESNFDPNAVSIKGARGLMQIMPQNDASLNISNPFDPSQNIMGGTRYLGRMLARYKNLSLALAAYNAGPLAVDKYQKIPPYKETRKYVSRVYNLYLYYRQQWYASSLLD